MSSISGWWHSVLNLEESIAVTQNYAGDANLPNVLKFLRNKKKQTLQIGRLFLSLFLFLK
jgi:hypothetical protein